MYKVAYLWRWDTCTNVPLPRLSRSQIPLPQNCTVLQSNIDYKCCTCVDTLYRSLQISLLYMYTYIYRLASTLTFSSKFVGVMPQSRMSWTILSFYQYLPLIQLNISLHPNQRHIIRTHRSLHQYTRKYEKSYLAKWLRLWWMH